MRNHSLSRPTSYAVSGTSQPADRMATTSSPRSWNIQTSPPSASVPGTQARYFGPRWPGNRWQWPANRGVAQASSASQDGRCGAARMSISEVGWSRSPSWWNRPPIAPGPNSSLSGEDRTRE